VLFVYNEIALSVWHLALLACFPVFLFKQVLNVIQMVNASLDIVKYECESKK